MVLADIDSMPGAVIRWLVHASAGAAILVVAVLLAQLAFGRVLGPRWRYRIWAIVVLRLVLPVTPASRLSMFNFDVVDAVKRVVARPSGSDSFTNATSVSASPDRSRTEVIVVKDPVRLGAMHQLAQRTGGPETRKAAWSFELALFWTWLAGAAALALRTLMLNRRFGRMAKKGRLLSDPTILQLLDDCRVVMNLRHCPPVVETDAVSSPAVFGLWRSRLLLPDGLAQRLSPRELRLIFLHELSHIKCRDVAATWLLAAVQIVHWFNPLVWLAFSRCRADREIARDDMVLHAAGGNEAKTYGSIMIKLMEAAGPQRWAAAALGMIGIVGIMETRSRLARRIAMIAAFKPASAMSGVAGALIVFALGCTTLTSAREKPSESKPRRSDSPTARAHPPATLPAGGELLTRVYDIRDLIVSIPDFEDAPDAIITRQTDSSSSSTTRPAPRAPTREQNVAQIVNLIHDSIVGPDHWNGGESIRELSGQLIVKQTPRMHDEILSLLKQLRETRSIQFVITMRLISIDPAILEKMGLTWPAPSATGPSANGDGLFLDDQQVESLMHAMQDDPRSTILSAPRITLFNGQRAYVMVTQQRAYVSGYTAIKSAGGETRYEPETSVVQTGLTFDAQAVSSADRKWDTLTLRPRISAVSSMAELPWPGRPPGSDLEIQQPKVNVSELRTTISIPDRKTLLLRGLRDPGGLLNTGPGRAGAGTTRPSQGTLFLMVKPVMIMSVEQEEFPLLNPTTRRSR